MKIKFIHDWPLEETLVFEDQYSDDLKIDLAYKKEFKALGGEFIYILDAESNVPIGETYFIEVKKLNEDLQGLSHWLKKNAVYVYSTTILPQYQHKGFGKILKAYFLGYVRTKYRYAIGHARENGSIKLNKNFGAQIISEEINWQNSGETYYFYNIDL